MQKQRQKALGIGVQSYTDLIDNDQLYVDKTRCLMSLLESGYKATLFTRPRRFGKSLMLSMIRAYLELEWASEGQPLLKERYFQGTAIYEAGERYRTYMGAFPVIHLDFGPLDFCHMNGFIDLFVQGFEEELKRLRKLYGSDLFSAWDRNDFYDISNRSWDWWRLTNIVSRLSNELTHLLNRQVVILLDEYDAPVHKAYLQGLYPEMIRFYSSFMNFTFKSNEYLYMGVLTGALRVSKESMFSGFNNANVDSLLDTKYSPYFGFTQEEVEHILAFYDLSDHLPMVEQWYDGYLFGPTKIYNPWSLLKYVDALRVNPDAEPIPYWIGTSGNSLIRETLMRQESGEVRYLIGRLLEGETIEKPVDSHTTFDGLKKDPEQAWGLFLFGGYLKSLGWRWENYQQVHTLAIPNLEIKTVFSTILKEWFTEATRSLAYTDLVDFEQNLWDGRAQEAEHYLQEVLLKGLSYMDYRESSYHMLLLGILSVLPGLVRSNAEYGEGRPDIVRFRDSDRKQAIVLELKTSPRPPLIERDAHQALAQIKARRYAGGIYATGVTTVVRVGIAFNRKNCKIVIEGGQGEAESMP